MECNQLNMNIKVAIIILLLATRHDKLLWLFLAAAEVTLEAVIIFFLEILWKVLIMSSLNVSDIKTGSTTLICSQLLSFNNISYIVCGNVHLHTNFIILAPIAHLVISVKIKA